MSALSNKVNLIGHLGHDPELIELSSGRILTRFSVATRSLYRDSQGEKKEDTQWHNIIAWGKLAEIAGKYLKKGNRVALQGKLNNRQYEGKEGETKYTTEVVINELMMLG